MKYLVYIWVNGTEEQEPFQSIATVHADNPVEAAKKMVDDIDGESVLAEVQGE